MSFCLIYDNYNRLNLTNVLEEFRKKNRKKISVNNFQEPDMKKHWRKKKRQRNLFIPLFFTSNLLYSIIDMHLYIRTNHYAHICFNVKCNERSSYSTQCFFDAWNSLTWLKYRLKNTTHWVQRTQSSLRAHLYES